WLHSGLELKYTIRVVNVDPDVGKTWAYMNPHGLIITDTVSKWWNQNALDIDRTHPKKMVLRKARPDVSWYFTPD
ncbi:hypothetical protein HK097_004676, partial [Rhizophlyctis rosea]